MKNLIVITFASFVLLALNPGAAQAGFPDDFSDVTWIDPNISSWPVTAQVSVNVRGSRLVVNDSKREVWPRRFHSNLRNDCCNRSLWIFVKLDGRWYASTFEFMRFGQVDKQAEAVNGQQIKRPPFFRSGYLWRPAEGEVYGFMTSGMARFNFDNVNVRERSNISLYRWGVGPTNNVNFEEVPRDSTGRPFGDDDEEEETEDEPCVEPVAPPPVVRTHTYTGTATGRLVVSGANNQTADFSEDVRILVNDNRGVTFTVGDESFSTRVRSDGSFGGAFEFDIGGAGICIVGINVTGAINGRLASGNASGSDSCAGNTATFTASFNASSSTEPNYVDQRPPTRTPRVCSSDALMAPILPLLIN